MLFKFHNLSFNEKIGVLFLLIIVSLFVGLIIYNLLQIKMGITYIIIPALWFCGLMLIHRYKIIPLDAFDYAIGMFFSFLMSYIITITMNFHSNMEDNDYQVKHSNNLIKNSNSFPQQHNFNKSDKEPENNYKF